MQLNSCKTRACRARMTVVRGVYKVAQVVLYGEVCASGEKEQMGNEGNPNANVTQISLLGAAVQVAPGRHQQDLGGNEGNPNANLSLIPLLGKGVPCTCVHMGGNERNFYAYLALTLLLGKRVPCTCAHRHILTEIKQRGNCEE